MEASASSIRRMKPSNRSGSVAWGRPLADEIFTNHLALRVRPQQFDTLGESPSVGHLRSPLRCESAAFHAPSA